MQMQDLRTAPVQSSGPEFFAFRARTMNKEKRRYSGGLIVKDIPNIAFTREQQFLSGAFIKTEHGPKIGC
jgi:hypothetical protein